ncbi:MAG: DNRLRE domain-containing protein [Candidatus Eisenbacteria bacterium]|uniref:DNRLRE domain-containing protein n=1 Tax=Eiseniibacteriota bacterium TaxID=2212470 RepID=A0A933SFR5_UNCEI|nr:DNRLRE domain-containing protein [Candidatus Eisenbacteria bacterium]
MRRSPLARFAVRAAALLLFAAGPAFAQSTPGLVPLTDMGSGTYRGYDGGLYGGGSNSPPPAHLAAALAKAAEIVPRDAAGAPDPNGWIGFIAVGMSNTTHEFGAFERNADTDTTRNARVVLIDTGFGGQSADVIANPLAPYWTTMNQRVGAMGLTAAQVQVAWLKEAIPGPANDFPVHALALRDSMAHVVRNLHDKFPNLKIVYCSSRIYGGYQQQGGTSPEPQAFESGYSVRWLIEQQVAGDPLLNHDAAAGPVRAPLLLWGPYLWANGTAPRADGLTWPITDLETDRVHPAPSGEQKVAALLRAFFAGEVTAAPWWPAQPGARLRVFDATDDAHVSAAFPATNYGGSTLLYASQGADVRSIYLKFATSAALADSVLLAKLSLRVLTIGGGQLRRLDDPAWSEGTLTQSGAPVMGPLLMTLPQSSRDGTWGANVTPTLRADSTGTVGFVLTTPSINPTDYWSKEGGHAPRLVLVVATPPAAGVEPFATAGPRLRLGFASAHPAASRVVLAFELPRDQDVTLSVHGIDGRLVRALASGVRSAGRHEIVWDGRDARGEPAPAGVYFVRLSAGNSRESKRVVLLGR